jgi:hypothetical protein
MILIATLALAPSIFHDHHRFPDAVANETRKIDAATKNPSAASDSRYARSPATSSGA